MLDLSHLHDHKFKYNFQDSLNPICNYGIGIETAVSYHLYYLNLSNKRSILKDNIQTINTNILDLGGSKISAVLLFRNFSFDTKKQMYSKYHSQIYYFN